MNWAETLAWITGTVTVGLSIVAFLVKVIHHLVLRRIGLRRALYVHAVGEIMAHGAIPWERVTGWTRDPVFRDVVFEYLDTVVGDERRHLDELIETLQLREFLIRDARSIWTRRRLRAVAQLARLAEPPLELLFIERLRDRTPEVRLHAAKGLARCGNADVVPRLLDMLETESPWLVARLADVLVDFGRDGVPHIVAWLHEVPADQRRPDATETVARTLGQIGDRRACPALIELLGAAEPLVRAAAAGALGRAGTPAAVDPLMDILEQDEDWRVRAKAASSLGELSDPRATKALAEALHDPAWWVRQNAAAALASVPDGIHALIDAVAGADPYARDAALYQLGISGIIERARQRIEAGDDDEDDRYLLRLVEKGPSKARWP